MNAAKAEGFTLIELVIALTIMTLLIGIAVPSLGGLANSVRNSATTDEMESITNAILTYTEDTAVRPSDLDALYSSNVDGFGGPYIDDQFGGRQVASEGYRHDAWGTAYRFTLLGTTRIDVVSAGQDRTFGTSDDLTREIDVAPIFRRISYQRLELLNQAVLAYNRTNLPDNTLSTSISAAVNTLVGGGFLPANHNFTRDAWGDLFRSSGTPVVKFYSSHFGTTPNQAGAN